MMVLAPATVSALPAPYVNAAVADTEFYRITAADMERLRGLKILFGSRSFGNHTLPLGLDDLAARNEMYEIQDSKYLGTPAPDGGTVFKPAAFDTFSWVHVGVTASPWDKRIFEMKDLLESAPHHYQDDIDVFIIFFHGAVPSTFPIYREQMDSMRARNPHIRFMYVTAGLEAASKTDHNEAATVFSDSVRRVYRDAVPLYDMEYLLNDDGACGAQACEGYIGADDVHPVGVGQERIARGFLLMLYKMFVEGEECASEAAPTVPGTPSGYHLGRYAVRLTFDPSELPGCGIDHYLIRRDGTVLGNVSKGGGFVDRGLAENTGYTYAVCAVGDNGLASVWSAACTVRTLNDTVPPRVRLIPEMTVDNTIVLDFTEQLDPVSASDPENYHLDRGITVLGAAAAGSLVTLTVTPLEPETTYALTIGVTDNSVNANRHPDEPVHVMFSRKTVNSVLAYWPFDGSPVDSSGNGNDGAWIGEPSYGTGVRGQGLDLDGDMETYVKVTTPRPGAVLLDSMRNVSFCVWARKADADSGGALFDHYVGYNLVVDDDKVTARLFNLDQNSATCQATLSDIDDTEWHHYGVVYDGDSVALYVDGMARSRVGFSGNVAYVTNRNLNIGRSYLGLPWGSAFYGGIDEFRIYDWALSDDHIRELYAQGGGFNADSAAVASILRANGDSRTVAGISEFNDEGRIVKLWMQNDLGGSVFTLTSAVGQLTELEVLHLYGRTGHDHTTPMLTYVSPAIANCSKLRDLVLSDNDLESLPDEIVRLTGLAGFAVNNNRLCSIGSPVREWLDANDPDWESTQYCPSRIVPAPVGAPAYGRPASVPPGYYDCNGSRIDGVPSSPGVYVMHNGRVAQKVFIPADGSRH